MDYKICSMMLRRRLKERINLEMLYPRLLDKYRVEYNPEVTNRMVVHLDEASILFFMSGTIQVYLKNPGKRTEVMREIDRMLGFCRNSQPN